MGVFGSYARGDDNKGSDIDFLFKIDHSKRSFSLFDLEKLKNQLEGQFNRPIDLISKLSPHVESYVRKDLVTLYDEENVKTHSTPSQKDALFEMFSNAIEGKKDFRPDLDSSNFRKNMAKTLGL